MTELEIRVSSCVELKILLGVSFEEFSALIIKTTCS